jgi:hypothetical protein
MFPRRIGQPGRSLLVLHPAALALRRESRSVYRLVWLACTGACTLNNRRFVLPLPWLLAELFASLCLLLSAVVAYAGRQHLISRVLRMINRNRHQFLFRNRVQPGPRSRTINQDVDRLHRGS